MNMASLSVEGQAGVSPYFLQKLEASQLLPVSEHRVGRGIRIPQFSKALSSVSSPKLEKETSEFWSHFQPLQVFPLPPKGLFLFLFIFYEILGCNVWLVCSSLYFSVLDLFYCT